MSFTFRPAKRENVGLIIGLAGASGSGKTYSAMRLASGIVGKGKRFAVIDTEARRALHYAGQFDFDHGELSEPFTPERYLEAIKTADKAGYPAIVVDSMSHEHAGDGGLLDWHEAELGRMAGADFAKRERCAMTAWIAPKMAHKRMIQGLLQVRAHLILCFRAEERIKVEKVNGKMTPTPQGWQPVCEKNVPYEMTASVLMTPDKPGFPQPIKLQEQHRPMFPLDQPLSERSGELIAAWAGGVAAERAPVAVSESIDAEQLAAIKEAAAGLTIDWDRLYSYFGIAQLSDLPRARYDEAMQMLAKRRATMNQKGT